jgi:hypothetical protein
MPISISLSSYYLQTQLFEGEGRGLSGLILSVLNNLPKASEGCFNNVKNAPKYRRA